MSDKRLCTSFIITKNVESENWGSTYEILVCTANAILVVPTVLFNVLVILTITRTPSLRKPSYFLICSLAFTDLGVGILVQPLYILRKIAALQKDYDTYCKLLQAGDILAHLICCPSFFIVTATSVDRYLAITTGVKYRTIVTTTRIVWTGICALMFAATVTSIRIAAKKEKYMAFAAVIMFFCLIIIVICYSKSLAALKKLQGRVGHNGSIVHKEDLPPKSFDIAQYKKALITMGIITSILFICYIPFVSVVIGIAIKGRSPSLNLAREITFTLLYVNSCLTPLVYGLRSNELKAACKDMLVGVIRRASTPVEMTDAERTERVTTSG
ncbi:histamine H2 receptor-like [Exaiptasia diaphana]|uniref:G-protein coupled receptors family 1 profile domain-containing protein n=1 Tax=Exaiptasia diaphana TaxID=2652724 RepID=A0A913YCJ6_EXADI|nr:histamine H2 receptor-like [Exaiptasia diaphana]XP_020893657.1 histamine H2 receptor-like [Exaiptasia diaphana]XP_028513019.1 histamine H2 receptor-like [Exaiptasia diaphana]XP_028513020.1 histamine H2 receptor-like [Exaiptasia diaphana]XP_028513021.1 histamine H2 receptor-like [Exaiptasia diaphana]XP_028513022.1 histamine H2 receptor-like [Exaiptasia diaphana]XP_028513023.1 histamine H2 receptor-like [Exaiptasia diaphana]